MNKWIIYLKQHLPLTEICDIFLSFVVFPNLWDQFYAVIRFQHLYSCIIQRIFILFQPSMNIISDSASIVYDSEMRLCLKCELLKKNNFAILSKEEKFSVTLDL